MKGWRPYELGTLLRKRADWVTIEPDKLYKQVTVKLWGKGVELRAQVPGAAIAATAQLRIHEGDFIMSRIDARHGAFGLVPCHLDGAVVSQDFPTFEVRDGRLLPQFLNWMSKTSAFIEICKRASEGTTNRVRLKEDRFLSQKVLLPSFTDQQRIVSQLDAVTETVAKFETLRREMAADLVELIVSSNRSYSAESPLRLGEAIFLDENRIEIQPDTEYPQVGILGFGRGLFIKSAVRGDETTYKYFNKLGEEHFVVSQVKGWEGAVAVCSQEYEGRFVSPEYRTFKCNPLVLRPRYLSYLCRTPWFHSLLATRTRGQGARRERLRPEMLVGAELPLPTLDIQERLEKVFSKAAAAQTLADRTDLQVLVPSLISRAFEEMPTNRTIKAAA